MNNKWTVNDMPSLKGKTLIVTGGNSGLGYQAVRAFASKGGQVIMACRSISKGEEAKKQIIAELKTADITVMNLDLNDLSSVKSFVEEFRKTHEQLHVLLNNAGIMMTPYSKSVDGIESQQATNHFAHFALTGLLMDIISNTPKSRVVNVSSIAHRQGKMDFNNLLYDKGQDYSPMKAYGRSKLENLLFTFQLQKYFEARKIDAKAVVAHPGVSNTNLFNNIGGKFLMTIFKPLFGLFVQPASMGALPEIRAAVDPAVQGGEFYGPNGRAEMKGYPVVVQPDKSAFIETDAPKLWKFSEEITGVKFY